MIKLTEEKRKALTEFLGECWHKIPTWNEPDETPRCNFCCKLFSECKDRTFTTWKDLGVLKERLVEEKKWGDFMELAYDRWVTREDPCLYSWLLHPTRFCWLVSEFLRERKG